MRLFHFLFRLDGRASRLDYWRYQLLQVVGAAIITALTIWVAELGGPGLLPFLLMAPLLAGGVVVVIRRAHDRGKSAAWGLFFAFAPFTSLVIAPTVLSLLPDKESPLAVFLALLGLLLSLGGVVFSIWALVELGFLPGQPDPNRYGPPPKVRLSLMRTVRG